MRATEKTGMYNRLQLNRSVTAMYSGHDQVAKSQDNPRKPKQTQFHKSHLIYGT